MLNTSDETASVTSTDGPLDLNEAQVDRLFELGLLGNLPSRAKILELVGHLADAPSPTVVEGVENPPETGVPEVIPADAPLTLRPQTPMDALEARAVQAERRLQRLAQETADAKARLFDEAGSAPFESEPPIVPQFKLYPENGLALSADAKAKNYYMELLNLRIFQAVVLAPIIRANYRYVEEDEHHVFANVDFALGAGSIVERDFQAAWLRTQSAFGGWRTSGLMKQTASPKDFGHLMAVAPVRASRTKRNSKAERRDFVATGLAADDGSPGTPEYERLRMTKYFKLPKYNGITMQFGWVMHILKNPHVDPYYPLAFVPRSYRHVNIRRVAPTKYVYPTSSVDGVAEILGPDAIDFDKYIFNKPLPNWFWHPGNLSLTLIAHAIEADRLAASGIFDDRLDGGSDMLEALRRIPFGWAHNPATLANLAGQPIELDV